MSGNHRLQTKNYGTEGQFIGICSCRTRSEPLDFRQGVEDWHRKHLDVVERVRIHLGTFNPTVANQVKWYREREAASRGSERKLWKQLADELESRLPEDPAYGLEPLF